MEQSVYSFPAVIVTALATKFLIKMLTPPEGFQFSIVAFKLYSV